MNMKDKWVPPFQLLVFDLHSCKVGPNFPNWLRGQTRICYMDLSNTSIGDVIPNLLWNLSSLEIVYLSDNNITGNQSLSFQFSKIQQLYLSSNNNWISQKIKLMIIFHLRYVTR
jgi:hypothetical protein